MMRIAVLSLDYGGRIGTGREDAAEAEAEAERERRGAENIVEKRKRRGEDTGGKRRGGGAGEGAGLGPEENRERTDYRGLV